MSNNPFNHSHFIGYINQVLPQYVKVHFPSSVLMKSFTFYGEELKGGLVGNYVVIEGEKYGFLGKILELSLPEKERLELSEKSFSTKDFHPTGKIEILLSFELFNPTKIDKGLNSLPMIGSKVFICSSEFIKGYFKNFGVKDGYVGTPPTINLGHLTYDKSTLVELSQQALFGRHCAIVGTTGGGKSYTVSRLLEGIINNNNKAIIIDPTGEYSTFDNEKDKVEKTILISNSCFSYKNLTISDLFVLFKPAGQVQQPILLEAIKSLKMIKVNAEQEASKKITCLNAKTLIKTGTKKSDVNNFYFKNISEIDNLNADFDITQLINQIKNECIWDSGGTQSNPDTTIWGGKNDNYLNNCISLILRINNVLQNNDYKKMFGFEEFDNKNDLISIIDSFLKGDKNILRIGFENVPYNFQVREILANSIGKYLLNLSRENDFKEKPLVLFVDEAHQFFNKKVKDEYFESTELNSFDTIAKESRKYGLFLCISTQMPRDIPNGTLSQIGTFIAHRLINYQDKEAIANACSSANRDTLAFLPVLGSGEAILMGVDFPMPVMLKIESPQIKPNSETPLF